MSEVFKNRSFYIISALILFLTECLIALFVHDRIVRPYIGDLLVVILIYMVVRSFIPKGIYKLPLYVFIFAVIVEILQFVDVVGLLRVSDMVVARTIIGTNFSWIDIIMYAIGCVITWVYQVFICKDRKTDTDI